MCEQRPQPAEAGPLRLAATLDGPDRAPVLVLGNSLGTTRAVWDRQADALGRHFRLLRLEYPGHGGSPAPLGPYTIGQLAGGVLALLDRHGIDRAAYCGVSLGGMIGIWLAAHAPERIGALGLCCTSAFLPPAAAWTDRAAQVRGGQLGMVSQAVVSRWFTPAFRARCPDVPAYFAAELASTDPEGYAGCCEAIAALDLRSALPRITAPVLVIAAAEDPATPPPHGAAIARAVRCSRLIVVRGAAHLANVSAPGQVSVALTGFLQTAWHWRG